jgi:psiF repeat
MSLLIATSLMSITAAKTAHAAPAQSSSASAQDKAKTCNNLADKKGLKGSDRQTFMQDCLNKAADTGSSPNVSQQDKAKTCNNLADRKNLTGSDRRSFVKDCMKKANPQ